MLKIQRHFLFLLRASLNSSIFWTNKKIYGKCKRTFLVHPLPLRAAAVPLWKALPRLSSGKDKRLKIHPWLASKEIKKIIVESDTCAPPPPAAPPPPPWRRHPVISKLNHKFANIKVVSIPHQVLLHPVPGVVRVLLHPVPGVVLVPPLHSIPGVLRPPHPVPGVLVASKAVHTVICINSTRGWRRGVSLLSVFVAFFSSRLTACGSLNCQDYCCYTTVVRCGCRLRSIYVCLDRFWIKECACSLYLYRTEKRGG